MRRMKKKDGHVPHVIHCRGCERNLIIAKYLAFPDSNTPRENIYEIVDPTSPMFSVRCPCGLYTVSVKKQGQQSE